MRTLLLAVAPCIFLGGLLLGAFKLHSLSDNAPAACTIGTCPLSISAGDSGKTFVYGVTTRFSVFLDEANNPKAHLVCTPSGVIGGISNTPPATPPTYAATFEGVAPGTCMLADDNFSATIIIQ